MSTRGILGFAIDGEVKVTYNHSDSYPEGLGTDFLAACRVWALDPIETLIERIENLKMVDDFDENGERVKPDADAIEALLPYTDKSVDRSFDDGTPTWYQLTRRLQGDIPATLDAGYMIAAKVFPLNSLFCEWGYVLNLTGEPTLEVYEGFKKERGEGLWAGRPTTEELQAEIDALAKERGEDAYVQTKRSELANDDGYKAIAKIAEFPLSDLPDDVTFLATVMAASRYDEEED